MGLVGETLKYGSFLWTVVSVDRYFLATPWFFCRVYMVVEWLGRNEEYSIYNLVLVEQDIDFEDLGQNKKHT
jgi:hypothetical protein